MWADAALILGAYLLGSLPHLSALAKLRGIELDGDYHLSLWEKAGPILWFTGTLGELAKGAIPTLIAKGLGFSLPIVALAGLAAVSGQMWPIFSRFDGEKGNSVGLAMAVALATRSSAKQFINLLPILIGVVLLIGLFNEFVSKDFLASIFSGNMTLDTLWGACFGSIFAGNPINSYVIGGELLKYDVSLFAVTALIITWVTVGLVQLPAEITALGRRFALLRNGLSFILSIPIAIITVVILSLVGR